MENSTKRDFVTVNELSVGFSEYSLKQDENLVGKKVDLYFEDESKMILEFIDKSALRCIWEEDGEELTVAAEYILFNVSNNIYYLSFVRAFGDAVVVNSVLDFDKSIVTASVGMLPTKEEVNISQFERGDKNLPLTSITVEFKHGSIGAKFSPDTKKHETTKDLLGERVQFVYSGNDVYEHIYLNENFYTWQCLKGVEKGLCDTDRCYFYKIDENLYWFVWAERIVPTIGSVFEDFNVNRSYGTIYGYKDYSMTRVINFEVGSYATVLNKTEYTFDKE